MNFFLSIISVLSGFSIFAQSADEIAKQFQPLHSEIAHEIIKAKVWGIPDVVIVFYSTTLYHYYQDITYERQVADGYLFIPYNATYQKVFIGRFEDDNVDTKILSVFFANADDDKDKELVVMTTNTHRLQYLYEGTHYNVSFYDAFSAKHFPKELTPVHNKVTNIFSDNFEGLLDDKYQAARFKSAADVKKQLQKSGY